MKRTLVAGFVGAIVLTTMLVAPAAQASVAGRDPSTSCAFTAKLTFKPALEHGFNRLAFIKLRVHLRGCSGASVTSADGAGGSQGDLRCKSGHVTGRAAAKAQVFWDTGDTSGLNFFFEFGKSRLHGVVTDSLFKGEKVRAENLSVTPTLGDCAESPLVRSTMTGTLEL